MRQAPRENNRASPSGMVLVCTFNGEVKLRSAFLAVLGTRICFLYTGQVKSADCGAISTHHPPLHTQSYWLAHSPCPVNLWPFQKDCQQSYLLAVVISWYRRLPVKNCAAVHFPKKLPTISHMIKHKFSFSPAQPGPDLNQGHEKLQFSFPVPNGVLINVLIITSYITRRINIHM